MFKIFISTDINTCEKYCEDILNSDYSIIGLDCEYTNNLCSLIQICIAGDTSKKDTSYVVYPDLYIAPSTIQYCDGIYSIYLLHLAKISSLPTSLNKLLKSVDIVKVGCGIINDSYVVEKTFNQGISAIIDNQLIAKSLGHVHISMNDLAFSLFSIKKVKQKGLFDWNMTLTEHMIKYSAYDAYLSLIIYFKLIKYEKPYIMSSDEDKTIESPEEDEDSVELNKDTEISRTDYILISQSMSMLAALKRTTLFNNKKDDVKLKKVINTAKNSCRELFDGMTDDLISEKVVKYLEVLHEHRLINFNKSTLTINLTPHETGFVLRPAS